MCDCSLTETGGDVIELHDGKDKDATNAEKEKHEQKRRMELSEKHEQKPELKEKEEQNKDVDTPTGKRKHRGIRVLSI